MAHTHVVRRHIGFALPIKSLLDFLKKNAVMVVAFCAAAVTTFIVPVDSQYAGYFDFKTLTCLFCVLAVVCALKNIRFFYMLAERIVKCFKTAKGKVIFDIYGPLEDGFYVYGYAHYDGKRRYRYRGYYQRPRSDNQGLRN